MDVPRLSNLELVMVKPNHLKISKGGCEMKFDFGPDNTFGFSSISRKRVTLDRIWDTFNGPVMNPVLDAAPSIIFHETSGRVRIRESFRALDDLGNVVRPEIYVARTVTLKAGEYKFHAPRHGPGARDITITFSRPAGLSWTPPVFEALGLDDKLGNDLVLSRNVVRWPNVTLIGITFYGGQDCVYLDLDRVERCRKFAAGALVSMLSWNASNGIGLSVPIEAVPATLPSPSTPSLSASSPSQDESSISPRPTKTVDALNGLPANLFPPFSKLSKLIWLEKELAGQPSPYYEQSRKLLDDLADILSKRMPAGARLRLEIGNGLSNEHIWELFKLAELRAGVEVKSATDELEAVE